MTPRCTLHYTAKCYLRYLALLSLLWLSTYTDSFAQAKAVSNTTQNLTAVIYGGGQWLVAGENGTILSSSDGITWTTRNSSTTARLNAISYGGGQWITIGENGTILTSPDGIIWTAQNAGTAAFLNDISYGAGQWIIVTSEGTLTSPDGIVWTARGTPAASIVYGNGQWASAYGGRFQTSTDGINWEINSISNATYSKIRYGGGRWVMLSAYGPIIFATSSSDGVNWEAKILSEREGKIRSIAFGDGLWMGVGEKLYTKTSPDGLNWSTLRPPNNYLTLVDVSYHEGRWVLVGDGGTILYNNNPLPVSLVSFQAKENGSTAHLMWETAWEKGASHFLVERSRDAKSFEAIGRLEAQGTTDKTQHYNFLDNKLSSGIWYYRLRQVDQDGTFTYSSIIAVRIGTEPLDELTLSPNPSSGPMVLEYKTGISSIHIYSLTGGLILQQVFEQAVDQWNWEGTGQPAGLYLIRVKDQAEKIRLLRWVKQ